MTRCATAFCPNEAGPEPWRTLCRRCYLKKDDELEAQRDKLLEENARLRFALRDRPKPPPAGLTQERIRTLIRLCHPDKHGGSEAANEITTWLLTMRK